MSAPVPATQVRATNLQAVQPLRDRRQLLAPPCSTTQLHQLVVVRPPARAHTHSYTPTSCKPTRTLEDIGRTASAPSSECGVPARHAWLQRPIGPAVGPPGHPSLAAQRPHPTLRAVLGPGRRHRATGPPGAGWTLGQASAAPRGTSGGTCGRITTPRVRRPSCVGLRWHVATDTCGLQRTVG